MQDTEEISARLRDAASLPDLLAASFDAFEIIRIVARSCDQLAPELFAALMTTADAAVDGREAVTAVTALPAGASMALVIRPADAGIGEVTAALAALGTLLADRLVHAGILAAAADRGACAEAATAASRIHLLMAR
jgi:hypothetical protein